MYPNSNDKKEPIQFLEDGRVFLDYGPVSMVLMAKKKEKMQPGLCASAFPAVEEALVSLAKDLPHLRQYPEKIAAGTLTGIGASMFRMVSAVGEPTLTPMATVAGAISDLVADQIFAQGADVVVINNGGDIAIRLKEEQEIRMGIVADLSRGTVDEVVTIRGEDGIGGVCTSGLGGRSLTRGIANSVTVFAARCIEADACATHIANCSYVESERVQTMPAGNVDPGSDIADLSIVTQVAPLHEEEIRQGLSQIERETLLQYEKGNLKKLAAEIQGHKYRFRL